MRQQKPGAQIMCAVRSSAIVLPEDGMGGLVIWCDSWDCEDTNTNDFMAMVDAWDDSRSLCYLRRSIPVIVAFFSMMQ